MTLTSQPKRAAHPIGRFAGYFYYTILFPESKKIQLSLIERRKKEGGLVKLEKLALFAILISVILVSGCKVDGGGGSSTSSSGASSLYADDSRSSSSSVPTHAHIPEPTSIALLGIGLAGLAAGRFRKRAKK